MNNLEYFHQKSSRDRSFEKDDEGTLVVEPPTKSFLQTMLKTFSNATMIKLGLSIKSQKDQFCKKTGRENALKRLEYKKCDLLSIQIDGLKHIYYFVSDVNVNGREYKVDFALSVVEHTDNVYLKNAEFWRIA